MKVSRFIALVELLLILLPLGLVALWASFLTLPLGVSAMLESPRNMPFLLVVLFCSIGFVALLFGSVLVLRFIRHGRSALPGAPRHEWLGSFAGAFLAIIGALLAVFGEGVGFAVALPALLPLAHMCYEYHRAIANNSFKPNPLGGSA